MNTKSKIRKKIFKEEMKSAADTPIFKHQHHTSTFYCPLCGQRYDVSDYLMSVFKDDERALWLANMVMHYRHHHITWWNKCWGRYGWYYRDAAHFGDYDEEKSKVNEQAKRQIARKCPKYLIDNAINKEAFSKLQGTTEKTLATVDKILSNAA